MGWLVQIVLMKFEFCKIFIVVYMLVSASQDNVGNKSLVIPNVLQLA